MYNLLLPHVLINNNCHIIL